MHCIFMNKFKQRGRKWFRRSWEWNISTFVCLPPWVCGPNTFLRIFLVLTRDRCVRKDQEWVRTKHSHTPTMIDRREWRCFSLTLWILNYFRPRCFTCSIKLIEIRRFHVSPIIKSSTFSPIKYANVGNNLNQKRLVSIKNHEAK